MSIILGWWLRWVPMALDPLVLFPMCFHHVSHEKHRNQRTFPLLPPHPPIDISLQVLPSLVKLFGSADRGIRVALLQNLETFAAALAPNVVDEQVWFMHHMK